MMVDSDSCNNFVFFFFCSNVDKLRDFIRHVYVERRYTGERSVDGPSRVKVFSTL